MKTTDQTDFTTLLQSVTAINQELEKAIAQDVQIALAGTDPLLLEVLEYAMFSGGKRVRPLLTITSASLVTEPSARLSLLAVAFEYLHVATLIHDDVIDHAGKRRGKESVVAKYGIAVAILAGDWLHAQSMKIIGRLVGTAGLDIFTQATTTMVDGEFLQIRYAGDLSITEAMYFAVISKKTGNLIASACAMGALFAAMSEAEQDALQDYGNKLGLAFQIVDDLLDYLGDSAKTGKLIGNDFIEGKITLPLLRAYEAAPTTVQERMMELIQGSNQDRREPGKYEEMHAIIEEYQGFTSARKTAESLLQEGVQRLDIFTNLQTETAQQSLKTLQQLAGYILARNK